jgi:hypothetical protein
MGFAFTLTPAINKTDLTITTVTAIATTITQTSIGGSGTIIGTITIGIMIGITTGIDASRDSLGVLISFSNGWKWIKGGIGAYTIRSRQRCVEYRKSYFGGSPVESLN